MMRHRSGLFVWEEDQVGELSGLVRSLFCRMLRMIGGFDS